MEKFDYSLTQMGSNAVIVLGNLMDSYGILNSESAARAKKGANIFSHMNNSVMITCGWAYREDCNITVADALKNYLVNNCGISPAKILAEASSRDTVGDAFFTKVNAAIPLNLKNIIVVTSAYHVKRAAEIFKFIYGKNYLINVCGADLGHSEEVLIKEKISTAEFRKTFVGVCPGDDNAIYERMKNSHPYYNGTIFNKLE